MCIESPTKVRKIPNRLVNVSSLVSVMNPSCLSSLSDIHIVIKTTIRSLRSFDDISNSIFHGFRSVRDHSKNIGHGTGPWISVQSFYLIERCVRQN